MRIANKGKKKTWKTDEENTCSNCWWIFARARTGTFERSFAASAMARNQRFRRANSHVRQMRLGNLHIDRNEISPECIYRFLCICASHIWIVANGKNVCVCECVLLLFRIDLSEMQTRNRMVFT